MKRVVLVALTAALGALAADWLTDGGDPARDNWQQREKTLSAENVSDVKLLWKFAPDELALSSPVILGPIITHRGIKELVFVEGNSNTIYAIDADLGRLFWKRRMNSTGPMCFNAPPTPVIMPETILTEDDDEGHTPLRTLFFMAGDGMLHSIRPTTGEDAAEAKQAAERCPEAIRIKPFAARGSPTFAWNGRTVVLGDSLKLPMTATSPATWEDTSGVRWIYGADRERLQAWEYTGAELAPAWSVEGLSAPLIANGMVFAFGEHRLHALDARTGKKLFASGTVAGDVNALALANGHVCFTTSENILYCFGFPVEV
jgi:outer membrane protein assembly factor BamB